MQRKPILSLIVTVYNLEKYIAACLDSIVTQSEKDYEIILVNNSSTDNSGAICSDYASRFSQIRYFSLDGEPIMGRAHTYGRKKACGEYAWFIDGDDLLEDNACAIVVKALRETKADVYFGKFNTFLEGNIFNFVDSPYESKYINECSKDEALEYLIKNQQPILASWREICTTRFFEGESRNTQEYISKLQLCSHQDTSFSAMHWIEADSIHYIDQSLYSYRVRQASVSRTNSSEKIFAYCRTLIDFATITQNFAKTEAEKSFAYAYYKQFLFLLSTVTGTADSYWDQKTCDDIDYCINHVDYIDIKPNNASSKDFVFVNNIVSQGANAALTLHKEYCQNKIKQIAISVKDMLSDVYLAPTGNVGLFLKAAFEQQGINIHGFFDNDKAKDGMCLAGATVRLPSVAAKIAENKPVVILIGASYVSVPEQLKQQFISLGISENNLIIIDF